jgi:hypothetical protein
MDPFSFLANFQETPGKIPFLLNEFSNKVKKFVIQGGTGGIV